MTGISYQLPVAVRNSVRVRFWKRRRFAESYDEWDVAEPVQNGVVENVLPGMARFHRVSGTILSRG